MAVNKSTREIDEQLMELHSLFEISKAISSTLNLQAILNTIVLTPMGRMMINKAAVLLYTGIDNDYMLESVKGIPKNILQTKISIESIPQQPFFVETLLSTKSSWIDFLRAYNFYIGFPIISGNKAVGLLLFGRKLSGEQFTQKEIDFLTSLSHLSAAVIENGIMFRELQAVNTKLDKSLQELNTLFEISREFNTTFDTQTIVKLLSYALMGQLLVNKYAILLKHNNHYTIEASKGYPALHSYLENNPQFFILFNELRTPLYGETGTASSSVIQFMLENKIAVMIPMRYKEQTTGLLILGEKVNKTVYTEEEINFLTILGNQALISIENARLVAEMLEKQKMDEELALAREIQSDLLPKIIPAVPGIELEAVNIPSRYVGGDYYDFIKCGENTYGIVIADVSGKGVPAALLMAHLQASFHALSEVIYVPARLVERLNTITFRNTSSDKFITLFFCCLNTNTFSMEYCNAGHNPPIVISNDCEIKILEAGGLILGMLPDRAYDKGTIQLHRGDTVVMYTDGITEAMNDKEEEFGEKRLITVCKEQYQHSASQIKDAIITAIHSYCGTVPQSDDITLIVMKIL
jgi:sigma-B regulation protein RsbU (phosphoserine phosphatase)